jgi:Tfp pilus assembly protein PilV
MREAVMEDTTEKAGRRRRASGERRGREGGFTIIETSIALVVLLVAGLAAASLFMYAINYNTGANDRALAQTIAQRQMEVLRQMPYSQITSVTQSVTASTGRPFSVVTTVCNNGSAVCGGSTSVKQITVQVTPLTAGPSWAQSSVTLITLRGDVATGPYF